MTDERTVGLILRTHLLTETSLIVRWLTRDFGRIATVAKGARRPKSPFRGKLDLFYDAEFSFSRSRRSDLHSLREVKVRNTQRALRENMGFLQQAAYCAHLIEQTTETDTPLPGVYALLAGFLQHLGRQPARPLNIFAFEMKLLQELGQAPDLAETGLSGGSRQLLSNVSELDWTTLTPLKPSAAQTAEIQQFLHGFLIYHLGKVPKGRNEVLHA